MPFSFYFLHPVPMQRLYSMLYTTHLSGLHKRPRSCSTQFYVCQTQSCSRKTSCPFKTMKHGTVMALLSHEDRTPCSVRPIWTQLCPPAGGKWQRCSQGRAGALLQGDFPCNTIHLQGGQIKPGMSRSFVCYVFTLFSVFSLLFGFHP